MVHLVTNTRVREKQPKQPEPDGPDGLKIHPPLEPVPDHDWKGETWGLYWPDLQEFEDLLEETNYKKYYPDKSESYPPADGLCKILAVETLSCPKKIPPAPSVIPPPPPPAVIPPPPAVRRQQPQPPPPKPQPAVVMRKPAAPEPPLPDLFQTERKAGNKWDWMKDGTDSSRRARNCLSIYW